MIQNRPTEVNLPRIVDHDQRRAEILDLCLPLFAKQGYAALSMRGLARALGVSTGTLYYYFDNKKSLFEAMVRRLSKREVATAISLMPKDATPEIRLTLLATFVDVHMAELQQVLQVAMEYQRHQPDSESNEFLRDTLSTYREAIIENFQLSASMSETILSMLIGMIIQRLFDPNAVNTRKQLLKLNNKKWNSDNDE